MGSNQIKISGAEVSSAASCTYVCSSFSSSSSSHCRPTQFDHIPQQPHDCGHSRHDIDRSWIGRWDSNENNGGNWGKFGWIGGSYREEQGRKNGSGSDWLGGVRRGEGMDRAGDL